MGAYGINNTLEADFAGIDRELIATLSGKVLAVSGATGFLGSLLARLVIWANDKLGLSTRLILCVRNAAKLDVIMPGIAAREDVTVAVVDFSEPCAALSIDFDCLVHTAAITTSKVMVERPADVINIMINGTRWALESACMNSKSKVLFLSSMEACGSFDDAVDVYEGTMGAIDMGSVRSCYPEGKRLGELMCLAYAKQFGINAVAGRLAQTFGAGILPTEGRVFKQFASSAMAGEPIVLHTDGMSEGNYVYSTDALSAILLLLSKGISGETYNIANEACHSTIRGMAEMVAERFGGDHCSVVIEGKDSSQFGYAAPTKMTLRSNKLRALGWEPKVNLEESYRRLIGFLADSNSNC